MAENPGSPIADADGNQRVLTLSCGAAAPSPPADCPAVSVHKWAETILGVGMPMVTLIIILLALWLVGRKRLRSVINNLLERSRNADEFSLFNLVSFKGGQSAVAARTPMLSGAEEALEETDAAGDHHPELVQQLRRKDFQCSLAEYPYLLHLGEKSRDSGDVELPYFIRVWVEFGRVNADTTLGSAWFSVDDVERVYYRVHNTFPPRYWVLESSPDKKDFEIYLKVAGEFTIVAVVVLKGSGRQFWLSRYLELPGRPAA